MDVRPRALTVHVNVQHFHSALTNIRNIDSVHQFLQSSLPLFLTETQIFPLSDTTHFQFPLFFFPEADICVYHLFIIQLSPTRYQILTFLIANFDSCSWNSYSFPSTITLALFILHPIVLTCPFFHLLSSIIECVFITNPKGNVTIFRDCNIYSPPVAGPFQSDNSVMGCEAEQFALVNKLSHLVDPYTRIPNGTGGFA